MASPTLLNHLYTPSDFSKVFPSVPDTKSTALHSGCNSNLSVGVLVDGNVSNGPGLAAIGTDQVARRTVQRQGVLVVGIGGTHRELRFDIVVRGHGAASLSVGTPSRFPSPDHLGRWLLGD